MASARGVVDYPFDLYYTGLLGNIVMFLVAWGSTYFFPTKVRAAESNINQ